MTVLPKRRVGKTKLEVTTLGLGGAPMGGFRATISDVEAKRVSPTERTLRDLITSGFLSSERPDVVQTAVERIRPTIVLRLCQGRIDDVDALPALVETNGDEPLPIDAVSVGHYVGVRPQAAERFRER